MIQMKYIYTLLSLVFAFGWAIPTFAQDGSSLPTEKEKEKKIVRFNGLGRTILSQSDIEGDVLEADTATARRLTDGEFLLDLAVNATPNEKTEVQGILRLRNQFGGFFGAGISVEIRELWARGIIAEALKYRVGDMDIVMSPYTFFNPDEEGTVNEPMIFRPQKEVLHYEQFYQDNNTRRMQGGQLEFGLDFARGLDDMEANAFIARVRGTDFLTTPTRFVTGGQLNFSTRTLQDSLGLKADFGFNLVHTFDDLQSGDATTGIRNTVYTGTFNVHIIDKKPFALNLMGETGMSDLELKEDTVSVFQEDDSFLDIGLQLHLKDHKLKISAGFVDVGPDFFSIGAQSKRVDFEAEQSFFNRIGNERAVRMPGVFDLANDRALYTFQLSDRLMPYDPRFSNALPYGRATPNRRGFRFGVDYGEETDAIEARLDGALLEEIRGQGTFELKSFTLLRAAANFNFHRMANWKNKMRLTLGYQYEQTTRDGIEVDQVDLTSNLIEAGIEAELFKNFDLLLGAKLLSAEGNDYVPLIETFNDVRDFPAPLIVDDTENLLAAGFKYQFKEDIYLTVQYQRYTSERGKDNPNNFDFNHFFVLYNMNF